MSAAGSQRHTHRIALLLQFLDLFVERVHLALDWRGGHLRPQRLDTGFSCLKLTGKSIVLLAHVLDTRRVTHGLIAASIGLRNHLFQARYFGLRFFCAGIRLRFYLGLLKLLRQGRILSLNVL